jgi:hypothetical protein
VMPLLVQPRHQADLRARRSRRGDRGGRHGRRE